MFFVSLFVFDMQFFFVYMDDLIGKGIGPLMVMQMLVMMSATLVPLALPLAILLSAIMTFGNLGENYELIAIKSSGISLLRFMRPLLIFIIALSFAAFFFNNYVIPTANLKALSMLYDMRRSKPALSIRAGQFNNDLGVFAIKVGSKDKDGQGIHDIIIYDQTSGINNDNLILAKSGTMRPTDDKRGLLFRLENGWRYQEGVENTFNSWNHEVQVRMKFKRWDKMIDLSGLEMTRTNQELFKNGYQMMDVVQLSRALDTLRSTRNKDLEQADYYFKPYLSGYHSVDSIDQMDTASQPALVKVPDSINGNESSTSNAPSKITGYDSTYFEKIPDSLKIIVSTTATSQVRNIKAALDGTSNSYDIYSANILKHYIELHKRFTLSFACILMFLIGAPLGSIIRKGGLGVPIVVAIVFFLIYYILSSTGEKLALSGEINPVLGIWMATLMLLPIAVILIQQARNDSQIFSTEWFTRIVDSIRKLIAKRKARTHSSKNPL